MPPFGSAMSQQKQQAHLPLLNPVISSETALPPSQGSSGLAARTQGSDFLPGFIEILTLLNKGKIQSLFNWMCHKPTNNGHSSCRHWKIFTLIDRVGNNCLRAPEVELAQVGNQGSLSASA